MKQPRIIMIGDGADAPWHPLAPASAEMASILEDGFHLESSEEYDKFAELDKEQQYDICISYTDCWNKELTRMQRAGLIRFIAGGGSLVVIHNGISLQASNDLLSLIGGKFTGHPPYQSLSYYGVSAGHPILDGVTDFVLDEEPYMFDLDELADIRIIMEFEFEGRRHPAAWERSIGLGKVIYLQPGHHAPSFQSKPYRKLIVNTMRYAAGNGN